ncbi:MAG: NADH-quinone oxidoreductase subunit B [Calditrichaeota bacterium]|nr:NADH-quinone oxidoreductase subunit B [Calditrichota bacterium]
MSEVLGGKSFITTRVDKLVNWARKNSLWPMPFGTACCAIELMATLASRFDLARFGAEAIRFTPRQCDLMIVAGRVAIKELPILKRIWDQMPEPKWCISMGACASSGGIFDTYTLVQGIDRFIPVDVYIPGCPPRPEAVIDAVMKIQKLVENDTWRNYKQELIEKRRQGQLYAGPNLPWAPK